MPLAMLADLPVQNIKQDGWQMQRYLPVVWKTSAAAHMEKVYEWRFVGSFSFTAFSLCMCLMYAFCKLYEKQTKKKYCENVSDIAYLVSVCHWCNRLLTLNYVLLGEHKGAPLQWAVSHAPTTKCAETCSQILWANYSYTHKTLGIKTDGLSKVLHEGEGILEAL